MTWENFRGFVPIKTIEQAISYCKNTECENCFIAIEGIDHRTKYGKNYRAYSLR